MNINSLHTNQRLLVEELIKHGASVKVLDEYEELLEVSYLDKKDFLLDRLSSKAPYHVVKMTADKYFSKKIFKSNLINSPQGEIFSNLTVYQALQYAKTIYPVVLKPNWGSHGDHVQVNIENEAQLLTSIKNFLHNAGEKEPFIIERYYPWKEYRLFITSDNGFAVVHRECSCVIGDGVSSLNILIEKENIYRIALKKTTPTSLCPIVIDQEVEKCLMDNNIKNGLKYIPQLNEQVFLRKESNLAKGGKAIDMTDKVHPSIQQLALKTLLCFPGLPVAGLDLLCEDITLPLNENNYVIIEINSNPGLAMHTYPTSGKSRNVAKLLLNVMFPDLIHTYTNNTNNTNTTNNTNKLKL